MIITTTSSPATSTILNVTESDSNNKDNVDKCFSFTAEEGSAESSVVSLDNNDEIQPTSPELVSFGSQNQRKDGRKEGGLLLKSNLNSIDEGGDVQKMEESDIHDEEQG